MPYIDKERRNLTGFSPETTGELNYLFTVLCQGYLLRKGLHYQTINDIIGALEGAKQEFYRRVAVPYENRKIKENGDCYISDLTKEE